MLEFVLKTVMLNKMMCLLGEGDGFIDRREEKE